MSAGSGIAATPRERWLLFAVVGALCLVPIALVRYPPVLDLAQQTGQIPLFARALGAEAATYKVTWTAPNKLSYPLLALGWLAGGAERGPRIGLALCLLATLGAIHYLGAALDRPLANSALASVFVFSSSFYGGFFNFLVGGWGLALWLRELSPAGDAEARRRAAFRALLAGFAFYWGHALWLLAAFGLLAVAALARPATRRLAPARAAALLPFLAMFGLWSLATAGEIQAAGGPRYVNPWFRRIFAPGAWNEQVLGGIRGAFEPVALGLLFLWACVALWRARGERAAGVDRLLAMAGMAFVAATVALPDSVAETWFFARRWAMWGAVCLVLALPLAARARRAATIAGLLFVAAFVAVTAAYWVGFDRGTMKEFEACRRAVPSGSRLLFLDFERQHDRFYVYPTFQMAAYAALDRPVDLNFSFAEHRSSLVVRRELPRPKPWTPKLEHFPARVVANDLGYFDVVLLHVPRWAIPDVARKFPDLRPLTLPGEWWLLAVPANRQHAGGAPG